MNSILCANTCTLEIKKSTFIAYVFPVSFQKDIDHLMQEIRHKHPDASHHCSAYLLGDNQEVQRFDDDGEPSQTAGMPILEVIKKHDLTNILCIIVRYYGGIKLGAGGLIRAYAKATSQVLKDTTLAKKITMCTVRIRARFDDIGKVEPYIREHATLTDTIYKEFVEYYVEIPDDFKEPMQKTLRDYTKGNAEFDVMKCYTRYS